MIVRLPRSSAHRSASRIGMRSTPAQTAEEIEQQAARCMNCGVPFCHAGVSWRGIGSGCTLGNLIPEMEPPHVQRPL